MTMSTEVKITVLEESAQYDVGDPIAELADIGDQSELSLFQQTKSNRLGSITIAKGTSGVATHLFKVLFTNYCEKNCLYCCTRCSANVKRAAFTPEELAKTFFELHRKGFVQGLFLSSGILNTAVQTQDRMIQTVEIIRFRYGFKGYIHLKILPGAESAQIEQAIKIADRVSVNLEAPNRQFLATIAPEKDMLGEIVRPMSELNKFRVHGLTPRSGYTTQLVVGGAGETDAEILETVSYLYSKMGLRRTHYSAFSPVADSPLAAIPPTSPLREHRLYQADHLLRLYGFTKSELPFQSDGNLPSNVDPKLAWAEQHLELFPIEINRAGYEELLCVPGLGKTYTQKIIAYRRGHRITHPNELTRLGIPILKACRFLLFNGKLLDHPYQSGRQLDLFKERL